MRHWSATTPVAKQPLVARPLGGRGGFDPATVKNHEAYEDPHHNAADYAFVLVNCEVVVESDKHTGAKPGQTLRHQPFVARD